MKKVLLLLMLVVFAVSGCSSTPPPPPPPPTAPVNTSQEGKFIADDYLGTYKGGLQGKEVFSGHYVATDQGVLFGTKANGILRVGYPYIQLYQNGKLINPPIASHQADIYTVHSRNGDVFYILTSPSSYRYNQGFETLQILTVQGGMLINYPIGEEFKEFIYRKHGNDGLERGKVTGVWAEGDRIRLEFEIKGRVDEMMYLFWNGTRFTLG